MNFISVVIHYHGCHGNKHQFTYYYLAALFLGCASLTFAAVVKRILWATTCNKPHVDITLGCDGVPTRNLVLYRGPWPWSTSVPGNRGGQLCGKLPAPLLGCTPLTVGTIVKGRCRATMCNKQHVDITCSCDVAPSRNLGKGGQAPAPQGPIDRVQVYGG